MKVSFHSKPGATFLGAGVRALLTAGMVVARD
jgi:hypothetical protein